MKEHKHIEKENLPLRLGWQEHPQFLIYKTEKEGNNYRLHYLNDERGMSVYLEDKEMFDRFPHFFEVQSGGCYVDKGRWAPDERYSGTIICENVSSFTKLSSKGEKFKFDLRKPFLSSNKILTIESEKVGKHEIKYNQIVPQKYDTLFYNKTENIRMIKSHAIENLDTYLNGSIENSPF